MHPEYLFVNLACVTFCICFSSSGCQGLAVAYDCGSPWTFHLVLS